MPSGRDCQSTKLHSRIEFCVNVMSLCNSSTIILDITLGEGAVKQKIREKHFRQILLDKNQTRIIKVAQNVK